MSEQAAGVKKTGTNFVSYGTKFVFKGRNFVPLN